MKEQAMLRSALSDILKGFTIYKPDGGDVIEPIYIKHLGLSDYVDIEEVYDNYYDSLKKRGLETSEEILEKVKKNGLWSDKEENEINNLQLTVDNLRETKSRSITKQDTEQINNLLEKEEAKLYALINKKHSFLAISCEAKTNKKIDEYYVIKSMHTDETFSKRYLSEEDLDDLDLNINLYMNIYRKSLEKCSIENIKKIAISFFFKGTYDLAESVYEFYGKPICDLTYCQSHLASYGTYFRNIFQQYPNLAETDDPDKIIDIAKRRSEIEKSTSKFKKKGSVHHIGATSEDYEDLNMASPNKDKIFEEAGKKGKVNLIH